ncbi:MAG: VWA domain-containing protein, partial [Gammaproteobacteria bacterium]|nr:VWA domain-containing protein [Gammaproteobacteria bacterium]
RVTRFKQRRATTTIFAVDASGSAAVQRLSEAKGAVELLLADCYVRRDRVALITFRGTDAELALPPTRSLVRAKRQIGALPGGGGTPLAAGIAAALKLAITLERDGDTPIIVLLTDGRANIALDGSGGRAQAGGDALILARQVRNAGIASLLVDTSPRPQAEARALAEAMDAVYLPLPRGNPETLNSAVRATAAPARRG